MKKKRSRGRRKKKRRRGRENKREERKRRRKRSNCTRDEAGREKWNTNSLSTQSSTPPLPRHHYAKPRQNTKDEKATDTNTDTDKDKDTDTDTGKQESRHQYCCRPPEGDEKPI